MHNIALSCLFYFMKPTLVSFERGAECMKTICRRLCPTLVLAGTAVLIVGSGSQAGTSVSSNATSSVTSTTTTTTVLSKPTGSIKNKVPTSGVTSSLTSSVTSSVASKGTGTQMLLSSHAEALAKALKFDRRVFIVVKEETQGNIHRLVGYDESDYQIIAPGITVSVPKDKTDRILASLRKKLIPLAYLPFVVEKNSGLKVDKIGIIKGTDQYEMLRIMHTDGEEDDVSNQDIIDRLKEWERIASFDIIGVGSDWVEIEFTVLPKDMKTFAEELNEFCPDAIEQGTGTIKELIKEIKRTNRLFLLWN
jgi:hypothetical protein